MAGLETFIQTFVVNPDGSVTCLKCQRASRASFAIHQCPWCWQGHETNLIEIARLTVRRSA